MHYRTEAKTIDRPTSLSLGGISLIKEFPPVHDSTVRSRINKDKQRLSNELNDKSFKRRRETQQLIIKAYDKHINK